MKILGTLLMAGIATVASAAPLAYSDGDLSLTCPDAWTKLERSRPDRLVFRDPTGTFQLTVSILTYKSDADSKQARAAFDRLIEHRRNGEREGLGPKDELRFNDVIAVDGGYSVEFSGHEKARARRFQGKMLMMRGRIVTAYIEGLKKTENEMSSVAGFVFSSLNIL
jgi:hypothetical protein